MQQKIHALHSTEIGQFVNVIREIADQTNLLALNASIEAAGQNLSKLADQLSRQLAQFKLSF